MKVNKDKLKTALEAVKPGLSNNEIIEQSTAFAFTNGRVITYNNELCVSYPLEGVDIECAVEASELYDFIGKVKKEEIDIELTDDVLVIKAGRAKAGFPVEREIKMPVDSVFERKEWKWIPENFLKACKFAIQSCSKNEIHFNLMCVHVKDNGEIEATDNTRLSHWDLGDLLKIETSFLIPANSIREVIKLNPKYITVEEDWVHFQNETSAIISCRTVDDNFPDISKVLNRKKKGTELNFPENINEVLDKAQVFLSKEIESARSVNIISKGNLLLVESKSDRGWFKEEIDLEENIDEFEFIINPVFLKDILKESNQCKVYNDMLEFRGDDWVYMTMTKQKV
jgi:DNA polymerase III sliding clamp (beta) subunit (PCNA family)